MLRDVLVDVKLGTVQACRPHAGLWLERQVKVRFIHQHSPGNAHSGRLFIVILWKIVILSLLI